MPASTINNEIESPHSFEGLNANMIAFINGTVVSYYDNSFKYVDGIVIEGDKIVRLGNNNDIISFIQNNNITDVYDLEGKTLLPNRWTYTFNTRCNLRRCNY